MKNIKALPTQSVLAAQTRHPSEIDFLLTCARTYLSSTSHGIQMSIPEHLDGSELLLSAIHHRLIPIFYHSLMQCEPAGLPEGFLEQLRSLNHQIALKNLYLSQQLEIILGRFRDHGIPAIPYKGPRLALAAYGSLSLRQFCDLDVLLRPADISAAIALLEQDGYDLKMDLDWEYHLSSPDGSVQLDLHESIVPLFYHFPTHFFAPETGELTPEKLLILLSFLILKDCCHWKVTLGQFCDIAALLKSHPQIDWDQIARMADEIGGERILALVLQLTQSLLEIELAPQVEAMIAKHAVIHDVVIQIQHRLIKSVDPDCQEPEDPGFWEYLRGNNHRLYLQMRERPREKVLYCLYWLGQSLWVGIQPNEADWSMVTLPRPLSFLYYPLHIVRLVFKHGLMRAYTQIKLFLT